MPHRRRPSAAPGYTTRRLLGAAALSIVLVCSGLATASGPASEDESSRAEVSWNGHSFGSTAELAGYLSRRGISFDTFINRRPGLADVFGLEPVYWDGKRFWSPDGMMRWSRRHGRSYAVWAARHPSSAARLESNMRATVTRSVAVAAAAAPTAPILVSAAADTYVDASKPRSSFGSATRLRADSSPSRYGLLRFDLPAFATPRSVKLAVYAASSTPGFVAGAVAGSWNESTTLRDGAKAPGRWRAVRHVGRRYLGRGRRHGARDVGPARSASHSTRRARARSTEPAKAPSRPFCSWTPTPQAAAGAAVAEAVEARSPPRRRLLRSSRARRRSVPPCRSPTAPGRARRR